MNDMIKIQKKKFISKGDLKGIVELHSRFLEDSVFWGVGIDFLAELYDGIIGSEHGVIFLCKKNSEIIGFIGGATNTKKLLISFILKKITKIIPHIIRNPKLIIRTVQSILFHSTGVSAELLAILVAEKYRNRGIGKMLIKELMIYFKKSGVEKFKILTGVNNNANNFYRKMGFKLVKTFKVFDKEVNCYIVELSLM